MAGPAEPGFILASGSDLKLHTHTWRAEEPAAAIVIVHGYAEHGGRHVPLADRLVSEGYAVLAYDQRGFGRSDGSPGRIDDFNANVQDALRVIAHARSLWPHLPVYLFGHSMGGAVAALAVLREPECVDGLILSSPLLRTNESLLLQRIAVGIGTLLPGMPTVALDRSKLSRDPAVVQEASADTLSYHGRIRARTGREMVRAMRRLEQSGHRLRLPLLILHGTADALTDPTASGDLYARCRSEDKQLGLFEGLYHETFNEPEGGQVLDSIADWIEEHVQPEEG